MPEQPPLYIYGRRAVAEALRQGERVQKVYLLYGSGAERLFREQIRRHHLPCTTLSRDRFAEVAQAAGTTLAQTQGVIALLYPVPTLTVEELCERLVDRQELGLLVALDGIEDPQNLGAIARTAEAAGAQGLLLPRHHTAPLTPAALKAAAGALLHLPVAVVPNLRHALHTLRDRGWVILGTAPDGERLYWEPLFREPVVVVLGNEHRGMRPSVRAVCDAVVRIPLFGNTASLNVAAAAAVVLFEIQRQRHAGWVSLPAQSCHVPD